LFKTRRDKAIGAILKQNERLKRVHATRRSGAVCTMFAWGRVGAGGGEGVGPASGTRKVVRSTIRRMAQLLPIWRRTMNAEFGGIKAVRADSATLALNGYGIAIAGALHEK
jgi:hypothetical protein